jgi:endoglucanase
VAATSAPATSTPAPSSTVEAPATTASAAPTTTIEPPVVDCPETPSRIQDVGASSDTAQQFDVPTAIAVRQLPRRSLYVDPESIAAKALAVEADERARAVEARLAAVPTAFTVGDFLGDKVTSEVQRVTAGATEAGQMAVLQIYNLPYRDIGGGFSAGGASNGDEYRTFTEAVAAGIADRAAVIILEPDALGQMRALTNQRQFERYLLLNQAVDRYAKLPNARVYLDGTHCGWIPAELMAQRLLRAGVERAQGFFTNVANYQPTDAEMTRARIISRLTGGTHFVIDTGRNGNGSYPGALRSRWCNPPGRALGTLPTLTTNEPLADALLWVKTPGASDGSCGRGNPPAGAFWTARAIELATNAGW